MVPVTSDVASYFHHKNTLFTLKNSVVEHFMLKTLAGQLLLDSVQLLIEEVVFVIMMVVCTVYIFFVIINTNVIVG